MLIAVSGPQGTGKSTLIHELRELGYSVVERKTARSTLKDWGLTLDEVYSQPMLGIKFQDELLRRKRDDEVRDYDSREIVFGERSYADLFTYACMNLGKFNEAAQWMKEYYEQCKQYQDMYYRVYYIEGGKFPIEDDGVRGISDHYNQMIDVSMKMFTEQMTPIEKLDFITNPELKSRIAYITSQLKIIGAH